MFFIIKMVFIKDSKSAFGKSDKETRREKQSRYVSFRTCLPTGRLVSESHQIKGKRSYSLTKHILFKPKKGVTAGAGTPL